MREKNCIKINRKSRTYGVGDDQDVGVGGSLRGGLGEVADNGGVGVEEVITGHTGLAGNTGGDEDDLSILESSSEASLVGVVAGDGAVGVDVAQVGSDTCSQAVRNGFGRKKRSFGGQRTGSTTDIVEGKLSDTRVQLHQQGQRLANATAGTEDGDLGGL